MSSSSNLWNAELTVSGTRDLLRIGYPAVRKADNVIIDQIVVCRLRQQA